MAATAFLEYYWALERPELCRGFLGREERVSEQVVMKQDGILQIGIIGSVEGA